MTDNGNTQPRQPLQQVLLSWFPVVLRFGAVVGVIHQAVFQQFDRPYLLALYGAALGLGEVLDVVTPNRRK